MPRKSDSAIRIYDKMGKREKTIPIPWTPVTPPKDGVVKQSGGSAVAIDFSPDQAQRLMFVINLAGNRGRRVYKFRMVSQ